ncbi:MAG: dihydrodipicolinate synthase family protein, partial [Pirellulales bacterium]|nr:dihydrodipicolinate synthase family protein [Pirellulales bacterium]
YSADFPEGFRAGVELRGFSMGQSRQPMSAAQRVDRAGLQRVLQCLLSDFGFVDAPPEGCPARTGAIERDRVAQITASVIHELRQRGSL